jgi:hypothetical protein
MDQMMILSERSIIILWTNQDMMDWMSRILVGGMAGAGEDFGSGVGQMWLGLFGQATTLIQSQHDPNGPDDEFRLGSQANVAGFVWSSYHSPSNSA